MTSSKPARSPRSLTTVVAHALESSLLPGDEPFSRANLAEAARFVADAASQRAEGEAAIAVESVTGAVGDRLTRIAVINDNMPFLVDSIAAAIDAHGLAINRLVHPILSAQRDAAGALKKLAEDDGGDNRESIVYIETVRADARTRSRLRTALAGVLQDVHAAVADWPKMQTAMGVDAARLDSQEEGREGAALLRWFRDDALTQLGHLTRSRGGKISGALGICRKSARALISPASYDRAFEWFEKSDWPGPLAVKSNRISQVHRRAPLDLFLVPVRDDDNAIVALSVHAGLWTSAALAAPPEDVPWLRTRLEQLMEKLDCDPRGHSGKALVHALAALPHDLVLSFSDHELERVATTMMSLVDRPRPRILLSPVPLERHLIAFAWLPRDALSTTIRRQVQAMIEEAADAPTLDWSLQVEGAVAVMRFVIDIRDGDAPPEEQPLDDALQALVRGWPHVVEAQLAQLDDPARAAAVAARYAEAFPLSYRTAHGPAEAAADIVRLRHLSSDDGDGARDARLLRHAAEPGSPIHLKLYQRRGALDLSDTVPMLENFGFRVVGEDATLLQAGELGAIHDFTVDLPAGLPADDVAARAPEIERALAGVLNGDLANDAFNRLITAVGLAAHEVNWLRAWYRYLRQTTLTYGVSTVVDALQRAPQVARGLIDLFMARHDPTLKGDRAKAEARAEATIVEGLSHVSAINDDRLLRQYRSLIEALVRTNAFVPEGRGAGEVALAFKIDSALIPGMPKPVPWREIFVYSGRVEGVHLRTGPIARGGLRWSDRRDDFRTEILGLMKAQRVKNAVIVPSGAKGGFYPKQLPDPSRDRDAWLAEGKESYRVFIRTLLALTDNIVDGKIVHPAAMVIRDGDDPYFVVAADKGTASFSDVANKLAEDVQFWLGDAFASGGSNGYDHKAMGITARGAWLSVQRHFLELGVDVQTEPVRVVGCGDMSGDVFGNGMLLSKALKLVAAFDHRHVFIDPSPDPAKSWAERQRLFDLPRSSWDDYNKKLISKGGGVFARSLKQIPLSPEAREALGLDVDVIEPDALISAILKAPVDLLWFGGIGTYVKAVAENNVQVGDPANDAVRVNGGDVRARVIGEGANLGCTQAGRIDFALRGGRNNTDFIDNSAGVDCSDNEVNIKIALASAMRAGRLTEPARVKLLHAMTDEVAALVLEDNRLQVLAISVAETGGVSAAPSYIRLAEMLEERGQLDRQTEGLVDNETLARRASDGGGLVRPELAVLLSCAKLTLQDALEASQLPDDPGLAEDLIDAFPKAMRKKYRADILDHRLRREIIATKLANRVVNRLGLVQPFELVEEEGATLAQMTAAFVAAQRLFGMTAIWRAIETSPMSEAARLMLFDRAAAALRPQIADLLRAGAGHVQPSTLIAELQAGVTELERSASKLLGAEGRAQSARLGAELAAAGAPPAEAAMVVGLFELDGAVGLAALARATGIAPSPLTVAFIDLGARLGLDWAQGTAALMNPSDTWERLLVAGLARDFQQMRLDFLRRLVGKKDDPMATVAAWAEAHAPAIGQFRSMIARAQASTAVSPAILAQLASQARNLLAR